MLELTRMTLSRAHISAKTADPPPKIVTVKQTPRETYPVLRDIARSLLTVTTSVFTIGSFGPCPPLAPAAEKSATKQRP